MSIGNKPKTNRVLHEERKVTQKLPPPPPPAGMEELLQEIINLTVQFKIQTAKDVLAGAAHIQKYQ